MVALYFFHTCQKNTVFYSEICVGWNVNNPAEETTLSLWQLCKTINIQYHVITAAGHNESLGQIRRVYGLKG